MDYHGPNTVAYFRTFVQAEASGPAILRVSTIDDLALWVNGRFDGFVDRQGAAWFDHARNADHPGEQIPIDLVAGHNVIVIRVRGGVYASGGFYARIERESDGAASR